MSEPRSLEDEAGLYVLGRLGVVERREFEACLKESAELRALVRELEDGVVALAMAMPQRKTPPAVWRQIEKVVAREANRKSTTLALLPGWLKNGLAAAACLALGWLLHSFWIHRAGAPAGPAMAKTGNEFQIEVAAGDSLRRENPNFSTPLAPSSSMPTNLAHPSLTGVRSLAETGQIALLREQVAELETQMNQMTQVVAQQQALLSDPNRLAFFQLGLPNPNGGTKANMAPPSPELQRALFSAIARELGWVQPAGAGGGPQKKSGESGSASTSAGQGGVDYVDLSSSGEDSSHNTTTQAGNAETPSPTNQQAQASPPADSAADPAAASGSMTNTFAANTAIPLFVSGTNATFAFDASVVPNGAGYVNFWGSSASGGSIFIGGAVFNGNPLAVTVPISSLLYYGGTIGISASGVFGSPAGVIGQFQFPTTITAPPQPNPSP
jgi:hypothetical protein